MLRGEGQWDALPAASRRVGDAGGAAGDRMHTPLPATLAQQGLPIRGRRVRERGVLPRHAQKIFWRDRRGGIQRRRGQQRCRVWAPRHGRAPLSRLHMRASGCHTHVRSARRCGQVQVAGAHTGDRNTGPRCGGGCGCWKGWRACRAGCTSSDGGMWSEKIQGGGGGGEREGKGSEEAQIPSHAGTRSAGIEQWGVGCRLAAGVAASGSAGACSSHTSRHILQHTNRADGEEVVGRERNDEQTATEAEGGFHVGAGDWASPVRLLGFSASDFICGTLWLA